MAGVVKSMDDALRSMNLEKVAFHLDVLHKVIITEILNLFCFSPDYGANGQI